MTIRDCEVCPATFTATGDEVLCPVCAIARVRSRVASNLDLAVQALRLSDVALMAAIERGDATYHAYDALPIVRQALGKE